MRLADTKRPILGQFCGGAAGTLPLLLVLDAMTMMTMMMIYDHDRDEDDDDADADDDSIWSVTRVREN